MVTVLMVLGGLVVGYFIGRLFATPRRERFVQVQPPPPDGTLPPGESARRAAASVHAFGALVERLAARDVDISDLACVPGARWQLVVEKGADADRFAKSWGSGGQPRLATRVSWHAGDENVRVEKSVRLPNLVPNRWHEEPGRPIGPDADAIGAAEAFIIERFTKGAGPKR